MSRLWYAQAATALASTAALIFVLVTAVLPPVSAAISQLPSQARIVAGRCEWPVDAPTTLAVSRHLSLRVETEQSPASDTSADLQIVLGPSAWKARWVGGEFSVPYPVDSSTPLDRSTMEPRWDAWKPAILVGAAAIWLPSILAMWWLLGALYAVPLTFAGFICDRALGYFAAWRLAAAALMPGALFLSGVIAAYGWERLTLAGLALAFVMHILMGWVYAAGAIPKLDRVVPRSAATPFASAPIPPPKNPFATP